MNFFKALRALVFPPEIGPAVPIPSIIIPNQAMAELASKWGTYEIHVRCSNCGFELIIHVPRTCLVSSENIIVLPGGGVCNFPDCPRCATASLRKFERSGPDILQEKPFGGLFRRKP